MPKTDRGFASMDLNKRREIASKGGQAAHQKGSAHEWTREEAREAGRKGGMASHRGKSHQEEREKAFTPDEPPADQPPPQNDEGDGLSHSDRF